MVVWVVTARYLGIGGQETNVYLQSTVGFLTVKAGLSLILDYFLDPFLYTGLLCPPQYKVRFLIFCKLIFHVNSALSWRETEKCVVGQRGSGRRLGREEGGKPEVWMSVNNLRKTEKNN